jgi:nucleotide-binding universal stress UspA family protein
MYRTLLVPVDRSAFAEHALPLALSIARQSRASIHLVAVSTPVSITPLEGLYVSPTELQEEAKARYQTYLDGAMARLRERIDVPISGEVVSGEAAPTLCHLAEGGRYDLVVMATHGRSPLGRFWLGSVADDLIRHANLPLLLVRPGDEEPDLDEEPYLSNLVLPLDGTPLAEQILEPAVALAEPMPETEMILLRAIPATGPDEEADVADSHSYREAEDYLASVAARLEARGLKVRTHVVFEDRPAEAILHETEGQHAGTIALETHGRSGLSRLLQGSVADQVIRGTHVPVLVHRPAKV